jgi:ribosomal protein S17
LIARVLIFALTFLKDVIVKISAQNYVIVSEVTEIVIPKYAKIVMTTKKFLVQIPNINNSKKTDL